MPRPSLGHTHTQSPTLAFSECSSYDTDHPVATHAHILTCFGSSETTKNSNQVQCRPSTGHSPNQSPIRLFGISHHCLVPARPIHWPLTSTAFRTGYPIHGNASFTHHNRPSSDHAHTQPRQFRLHRMTDNLLANCSSFSLTFRSQLPMMQLSSLNSR